MQTDQQKSLQWILLIARSELKLVGRSSMLKRHHVDGEGDSDVGTDDLCGAQLTGVVPKTQFLPLEHGHSVQVI